MGRETGKYRFTLLFMNPVDVRKRTGTRKGHWFLFKRRRFHRKGDLYLTTHLYNADSKRVKEVDAGRLRKIKFDCFDTPSGVVKRPLRRNVKLSDMKKASLGYVSDVRPRKAKKEFDPDTRMRRNRK